MPQILIGELGRPTEMFLVWFKILVEWVDFNSENFPVKIVLVRVTAWVTIIKLVQGWVPKPSMHIFSKDNTVLMRTWN